VKTADNVGEPDPEALYDPLHRRLSNIRGADHALLPDGGVRHGGTRRLCRSSATPRDPTVVAARMGRIRSNQDKGVTWGVSESVRRLTARLRS
jgi:hypothetical protein